MYPLHHSESFHPSLLLFLFEWLMKRWKLLRGVSINCNSLYLLHHKWPLIMYESCDLTFEKALLAAILSTSRILGFIRKIEYVYLLLKFPWVQGLVIYVHIATTYSKTFEGKRLWLERQMIICMKTFVVIYLYIYIANQQGHNMQEMFAIEWKLWKLRKFFPTKVLPYIISPCLEIVM